MKILYIGGGFVGACSAAVSADSGHEVLIYDINSELIRKLGSRDKNLIESALYEKGLAELIIRNGQRLSFTDQLADVKSFIEEAGAVFMCLPTPEKEGSRETNMSYYRQAASDLAKLMAERNGGRQDNYILIINKSTVPIETIDETDKIMKEAGVRNFGVGSNPEFLVEGKAVEGSIKPDRVVVGARTEADFKVLRNIYNRFCESPNVSYIEVNPYEAAAGKLLANFTLFSKLANCFDVVGRVCEKFDNLQFENVRHILISDKRIGSWGFYNSLYSGGSCFIKDARSLSHQLAGRGAVTDFVDGVLEANNRQVSDFIDRAEKDLGFDWREKTVALLGLAFKRDTNDIRNSGSIEAMKILKAKGVKKVLAYDSEAADNFRRYFPADCESGLIEIMKKEIDAVSGAEALIVATDWPEFRALPALIKENMRLGQLVMDGRRMLQQEYDMLAEAGFDIIAVGSPTRKGSRKGILPASGQAAKQEEAIAAADGSKTNDRINIVRDLLEKGYVTKENARSILGLDAFNFDKLFKL